ncbi:MAG: Ig-like domain-containing protein [Candidatus Eremiobacteraeota bacterium]|nr:Ig-like domain-containing protein [Candidatus Eremiobacteraeota bacterium]
MRPFFFLALFLLFTALPASAQFFNITSSSPRHGSIDVPLDVSLFVNFNHQIRVQSIRKDILFEGTTGKAVPTEVTYSDTEETIYIHPKIPLKPGTYYVIYLQDVQATSSSILHHDHNTIGFTTRGGHLQVATYVSPAELTLPPGGVKDVTYTFIETGGGLAELMQSILVYEDSGGRLLSKSSETMKLIIGGNKTTKFPSSIAIPQDVGTMMKGQTIMVRRTFVGLDHDANKIELRTGARVTITDPTAPSIRINEVAIKAPEYGMMIPKGSIISAEGRIRGIGSGDIHGSFILNGKPLSFFVAKMQNGEMVKVLASEKAFAETEGKNTLSMQLISPEKRVSEEVDYFVATSPSALPILIKPADASSFTLPGGTPPLFRWSSNPSAVAYFIAIGKNRTFAKEDWIKCETNSYTPDWVKWGNLGSGSFYWAVKPIFYNSQEGKESSPFTFTITKK